MPVTSSDNGFKGGGGQVPKSGTAGPDGYTVNIRKHLAMGRNLIALVNIKIAGIYGSVHPTHIDNNRF